MIREVWPEVIGVLYCRLSGVVFVCRMMLQAWAVPLLGFLWLIGRNMGCHHSSIGMYLRRLPAAATTDILAAASSAECGGTTCRHPQSFRTGEQPSTL